MSNKKITVGLFIFIICIFIYGLIYLFLLRFETGDVYPPYSSLRSDPLGTRALYEGLANLNYFTVRRNYLPLSQIQFETHTTFFYLGTRVFDPGSVPEEFAKAADHLTNEGGRLVLTFEPVRQKYGECLQCSDSKDKTEKGNESEDQIKNGESDQEQSSQRTNDGSDIKNSEAKDEQSEKSDAQSPFFKTVSLEEYWGVSFKYDDDKETQQPALIAAGSEPDTLPHSISWHTILYFDDLKGPWKVLYSRDGHPVIVERSFNRGTILLAADSYFFSNEALLSERHPDLLRRLIGPNFHIIFDEAHFGIHKIPGLAGLIRNYELHWFFMAIGLLFILFVWKNSAQFVPPPEETIDAAEKDINAGRDYTQGLISLLRRNIPVKKILRASLEEWKKSFGLEERLQAERLGEIVKVIETEEALSENQANPIKGFKTISKILSEGK